jgi:hypothetical protein
LLQQLIVHNASVVAANYGMTVDELSNQVAHDKFYVPVVSESHEMIPKSLYIPFAIMCTIGMARFFMVLSQHWTW